MSGSRQTQKPSPLSSFETHFFRKKENDEENWIANLQDSQVITEEQLFDEPWKLRSVAT